MEIAVGDRLRNSSPVRPKEVENGYPVVGVAEGVLFQIQVRKARELGDSSNVGESVNAVVIYVRRAMRKAKRVRKRLALLFFKCTTSGGEWLHGVACSQRRYAGSMLAILVSILTYCEVLDRVQLFKAFPAC